MRQTLQRSTIRHFSSAIHPAQPSRTSTIAALRTFSSSRRSQTAWSPHPAPPRLPKEEQEIFEQLQRQSTGAFSTPNIPEASTDRAADELRQQVADGSAARRVPAQVNQSPHAAPDAQPASREGQEAVQARVRTGGGEELHPNVRRGAPPEFEGEVNPKTGETGGPKNEPLRWGPSGDWSFNGRVTDF